MNDGQKLLYCIGAGAAAFVAITALYYLEGREPNNGLVIAASGMAGLGLWHFLGRNKKS